MDDDAVANARTERSADWATEKLEPSTPVPEETPPATVLFEKQAGAASGGGERANVVEPQPTQAFDARAAALDEAAEQAESRDDDIPATAAFDAQAAASADADSSESEAVARAGKRWPGGKSGESASAAPGIGPPVVGRPGRDSTTVARPPGVLTAAGGTTYPLDRAYVIGRDPLTDEAVQKAKASPILLSGDRHISRIHARVFIEGAAVFVQDSSTPGGTYVAPPGASDWTRLGAQRFELKPGWSLRIGDRILTYSTGPGRARR
ncbi:FHA domain-containing protein [Nocardia sp. NPDC050406]|uniref:FHA domain-containing protein n=1 Tax=Nocardia sp. NPDC050406 TaxID=3364318 RepID=UPI00378ABE53